MLVPSNSTEAPRACIGRNNQAILLLAFPSLKIITAHFKLSNYALLCFNPEHDRHGYELPYGPDWQSADHLSLIHVTSKLLDGPNPGRCGDIPQVRIGLHSDFRLQPCL